MQQGQRQELTPATPRRPHHDDIHQHGGEDEQGNNNANANNRNRNNNEGQNVRKGGGGSGPGWFRGGGGSGRNRGEQQRQQQAHQEQQQNNDESHHQQSKGEHHQQGGSDGGASINNNHSMPVRNILRRDHDGGANRGSRSLRGAGASNSKRNNAHQERIGYGFVEVYLEDPPPPPQQQRRVAAGAGANDSAGRPSNENNNSNNNNRRGVVVHRRNNVTIRTAPNGGGGNPTIGGRAAAAAPPSSNSRDNAPLASNSNTRKQHLGPKQAPPNERRQQKAAAANPPNSSKPSGSRNTAPNGQRNAPPNGPRNVPQNGPRQQVPPQNNERKKRVKEVPYLDYMSGQNNVMKPPWHVKTGPRNQQQEEQPHEKEEQGTSSCSGGKKGQQKGGATTPSASEESGNNFSENNFTAELTKAMDIVGVIVRGPSAREREGASVRFMVYNFRRRHFAMLVSVSRQNLATCTVGSWLRLLFRRPVNLLANAQQSTEEEGREEHEAAKAQNGISLQLLEPFKSISCQRRVITRCFDDLPNFLVLATRKKNALCTEDTAIYHSRLGPIMVSKKVLLEDEEEEELAMMNGNDGLVVLDEEDEKEKERRKMRMMVLPERLKLWCYPNLHSSNDRGEAVEFRLKRIDERTYFASEDSEEGDNKEEEEQEEEEEQQEDEEENAEEETKEEDDAAADDHEEEKEEEDGLDEDAKLSKWLQDGCDIPPEEDQMNKKKEEKKQQKQPRKTRWRLPQVSEPFSNWFSQLIEEYYERSRMTSERRELVEKFVADLQTRLRNHLGKPQVRLVLFGSVNSGFGSNDCDLDICLVDLFTKAELESPKCHAYRRRILTAVAECLRKSPDDFDQITSVLDARTPIVKFEHRETGFHGDISVENTLALHNTELLKLYTDFDARVAPLGFAIKRWARVNGMNDASSGSISSYAYVVMLIHWLQRCEPPVLPFLQRQPSERDDSLLPGVRVEDNVESWEVSFRKDLDAVRREAQNNGTGGIGSSNPKHHHQQLAPFNNRQTLAQLFLGYLHYFSRCFDPISDIVQIRVRAPDYNKENERIVLRRRLYVEDPFDLAHNLTSGVREEILDHIIKCLRSTRLGLERLDKQQFVAISPTVVDPPIVADDVKPDEPNDAEEKIQQKEEEMVIEEKEIQEGEQKEEGEKEVENASSSIPSSTPSMNTAEMMMMRKGKEEEEKKPPEGKTSASEEQCDDAAMNTAVAIEEEVEVVVLLAKAQLHEKEEEKEEKAETEEAVMLPPPPPPELAQMDLIKLLYRFKQRRVVYLKRTKKDKEKEAEQKRQQQKWERKQNRKMEQQRVAEEQKHQPAEKEEEKLGLDVAMVKEEEEQDEENVKKENESEEVEKLDVETAATPMVVLLHHQQQQDQQEMKINKKQEKEKLIREEEEDEVVEESEVEEEEEPEVKEEEGKANDVVAVLPIDDAEQEAADGTASSAAELLTSSGHVRNKVKKNNKKVSRQDWHQDKRKRGKNNGMTMPKEKTATTTPVESSTAK